MLDSVRRWLGTLIERTCPTPPVLVGYAWGAAIGARFAADQSRRLSHLVLVNAMGLAQFEPAPAFARALNDFMARPTGDTHDRLWRQCTLDLDQVHRGMGAQWEAFEAHNLDRAHSPRTQEALGTLMELLGIPAVPASDLGGSRCPPP